MRYRFLFILLLFSLSACTLQVNVLTPQPLDDPDSRTATPPPFPTFTFTLETSELGTLTATPPPYPTFTLTPTITPSPLPRNVGTVPIQFEPNGTYVDVVDTILAGTSKTYSLNALKGQVMSISVHQPENGNWTLVPLKIVGADGTTLCPQQENRECYFWRGALPAAQNYFVTLTPYIDIVDFTLRVAINPPGAASQTFNYVSRDGSLSFSYPDDFAPVRFTEMYMYKFAPELTLQFMDTNSMTNTNLLEAYFLFSTSSDADAAENCFQPPAWAEQSEQAAGEVMVNGIQFVRSKFGGAATGNVHEREIYRTIHNQVCYEVSFMLHYVDVGMFPPEMNVTEFDRAALMQRFETILSTLLIKQ